MVRIRRLLALFLLATPLVATPLAFAHADISTVSFAFAGDTELGNSPQVPANPTAYLANSKNLLSANVVFANLEGTMTNGGTSKCNPPSASCYAFKVPPSFAAAYKSAGFTILNSANNHSFDFGSAGAASTTAALKAVGLLQAGLRNQITYTRVGTVKIAVIGFAPYYNVNNFLVTSSARTLIQTAKRHAQLVIVYMHVGAEGPAATHVTRKTETFYGENRGNPYQFAHFAIDAGADAVIGSGPHVLRGMEYYKGHLIAYSLGDFINYGNFAMVSPLNLSAILKFTLASDGTLQSAQFISVKLVGRGQLSVDSTDASAHMVNSLSRADFGGQAAIINSDGSLVLPG